MSCRTVSAALVCLALVAPFGGRAAHLGAGATSAGNKETRTHAAVARATGWTRVSPVVPRSLARSPLTRLPLRALPIPRRTTVPHARRAQPTPPQPAAAKTAASSPVAPNDPNWSQQWGLLQVEAPSAWALTAGASRPVVVAVVDSGVDPAQPDLQGALVTGADFADSTGSTADQYGHGTMVAGVIAARGNNGQGVAGACWACLIMPIKVLDANGTGTATSIADGIRWAADHGANVINMSFVLSGPDPEVEAAIAYAHQRGAIIVAAAGNAGNGEVTYPAAYPFVVSVAASDATDRLYAWSTFGSWVTLAAPGCTVTTVLGGGFADFCGTSAAAPLVAGLAGLGYEAGASSEADLEAALEQTAKPLPGLVGSGRVDALQLVRRFAST